MSSSDLSNKSDAGDSPQKKNNNRQGKSPNNDEDDNSFSNSMSFEDSSDADNSTGKKKRDGSNSKPGSKQGKKKDDKVKTPGVAKNQQVGAMSKKAFTQKINNTKKEKDLPTPAITPMLNQNEAEEEKPEEEMKKKTKKMPKISLKRQMTQRRMSNFSSTLTQNSLPRRTMASGGFGDASPFGNSQLNGQGSFAQNAAIATQGGRNSLTDIKGKANRPHGRQSMMVTQIKGLSTPQHGNMSNNGKHKSLGGAIEEASENESDEDQSDGKNETIIEFENEDEDPFKQYENDELFRKVTELADKITNQVHSEQDQNDIINYLKGLPCMDGKFDHLNKNLTKKLIDTFEVRFVAKGDYLFRQGEKPDYAYVILYGTVIYFKVIKNTFMVGQEPQSPVNADTKASVNLQAQTTKNMSAEQIRKHQEEQREKEMFENKRNKTIRDNLVLIEEEIKMPFEQSVGIMIGEIAMMNPNTMTRALSGMAKTDCIFLLLNFEAFDILVKEKEKKENESLTQFIFDSVPKIREQFQFKKVVKTVKILFPTSKYIRGKEIIKEADKCEKLYIIKEGLCAMYKQIEVKDMLGMPKIKKEKIMNIEAGGIFGEEGLIFDQPNSHSIVAITPVVLLSISYADLKREFKRLIPGLAEFYQKRSEFIQERYLNIKQARNYERKHFNSKIEKGSMNVFLQKDFKNQIDFADKKTKRKLQVFFLRKELQQLQDAKQRLNDELEKEKQELTNFHHTVSHNNSSRWIPPMVDTPQMQYVSKVLFPQRVNKQHLQQSMQNDSESKIVKQTLNIDFKKSVMLNPKLMSSQSVKSLGIQSALSSAAHHSQQKSFVQPFSVMSPQQQMHQIQQFQSLKNQRTQSHSNLHTMHQFKNNLHLGSQERIQSQPLFSPQSQKQAVGSIIDTDEDNESKHLRTTDNQHLAYTQQQRLKHIHSQHKILHNKAPLKGRAVSTLASYNNPTSSGVSNSQMWTPNNNISLKGSTIRSENSQQHFFDKRVVSQTSTSTQIITQQIKLQPIAQTQTNINNNNALDQ